MNSQDLTKAELEFLRSQSLTAGDVYDGRRESSVAWKAHAKEAGLNIVLGTACQKAGHRLRTRAGHCVQCDTSKISYQKRHDAMGYVYIAGSKTARLLKLGTAVDVAQRERNLQGQAYGGASDWIVLFSAKVSGGGRVEGEALRLLSKYRVSKLYTKDNHEQLAGEMLSTTLSRVMTVLGGVLEKENPSELWRHSRWRDYDFR